LTFSWYSSSSVAEEAVKNGRLLSVTLAGQMGRRNKAELAMDKRGINQNRNTNE